VRKDKHALVISVIPNSKVMDDPVRLEHSGVFKIPKRIGGCGGFVKSKCYPHPRRIPPDKGLFVTSSTTIVMV
tara:strand:+ start:5672 stop:5890 length:219 start_codon:yes stop_codon:yes gene_type:complete